MFIDFHCHPSLIVFNRMRNTKKELSEEFNIAFNDKPDTDRLFRVGHYTQSDLLNLTKGKVGSACVYLYVPERDLFIGRGKESNFSGLKRILCEFRNKLIRKQSPIRTLAAKYSSSFPVSRIRYLQSERYDYFEEFKEVLNFYKKDVDKVLLKEEGKNLRYHIARNLKDIHRYERQVVLILNIEGGHIISGGAGEYKVNLDEMLKRVNFIKEDASSPIFIFTLAHLFYNSLCGHCRSLHPHHYWIADQEFGMNTGITKEGNLVIKRLLNLNKNKGRRVLIDIKHMSIQSREEYYKKYIIPYNDKHKDQKIPIIASHIAYSGIRTICKMKDISKKEVNLSPPEHGEFYSGTYNLCDEEIQLINQSEGLIGLVLAKRFLTSKAKRKSIKDKKDPYEWGKVIANHILSIVKVMSITKVGNKTARKGVWDRICIGSDFDGFNEPLDTFYASSTFPMLKSVLTNVLKNWPNISSLLSGLDVEEVVDKFMYRNACEFLRKHFR